MSIYHHMIDALHKRKFLNCLIICSVLLILSGCVSHHLQTKNVEPLQPLQEKQQDEDHSAVDPPEEKPPPPTEMEELKQRLAANGVPVKWFDAQIQHESFRLHSEIGQRFQKSAEKQIDHDKKFDVSWYFKLMNVDARIKQGTIFIKDHLDILTGAEAKHGIHKELIAAIIGIETNFADNRQRGEYQAFNALVSQYLYTGRQNFAVRELTALYKFSMQTGHPTSYFTSSYAGAIGWGQFIPSSLLAFFVDSNGIDSDMDPFSIEDAIFSVENYLHANHLSGENIGNYNSKYKAVFAYNHSDIYVKAVLYIYDGLYRYFNLPQKNLHSKKNKEIEMINLSDHFFTGD
jgi:membrane-bound lytic murein transglycosylase B